MNSTPHDHAHRPTASTSANGCAQERALREERSWRAHAGDDPALAPTGTVARALRAADADALPPDFAARVAARAAACQRRRAPGARTGRALARALLGARGRLRRLAARDAGLAAAATWFAANGARRWRPASACRGRWNGCARTGGLHRHVVGDRRLRRGSRDKKGDGRGRPLAGAATTRGMRLRHQHLVDDVDHAVATASRRRW